LLQRSASTRLLDEAIADGDVEMEFAAACAVGYRRVRGSAPWELSMSHSLLLFCSILILPPRWPRQEFSVRDSQDIAGHLKSTPPNGEVGPT